MSICGIYKITNKVTKKIYIGSSIDIKKRWNSHRHQLRNGEHHNQHLQNSWDKYGKESFLFEIILQVDRDSLLLEEQRLLDETGCCNREIGYNKSNNTTAPFKGQKHSIETIEKLRLSSTGRKHSDETKKKISIGNKGKVTSREAREKMSRAKKGIAPAVAFHPPSEDGKRRISEFAKTRTGHRNPNSRLSPDQVEQIRECFQEKNLTIKAISEKFEVSISTIKRIKYGKTKY